MQGNHECANCDGQAQELYRAYIEMPFKPLLEPLKPDDKYLTGETFTNDSTGKTYAEYEFPLCPKCALLDNAKESLLWFIACVIPSGLAGWYVAVNYRTLSSIPRFMLLMGTFFIALRAIRSLIAAVTGFVGYRKGLRVNNNVAVTAFQKKFKKKALNDKKVIKSDVLVYLTREQLETKLEERVKLTEKADPAEKYELEDDTDLSSYDDDFNIMDDSVGTIYTDSDDSDDESFDILSLLDDDDEDGKE